MIGKHRDQQVDHRVEKSQLKRELPAPFIVATSFSISTAIAPSYSARPIFWIHSLPRVNGASC
ncbi:MAG: hypothetical protein HGA45_24950 [Chloroflexales bacterium]|nr:hypothetical protein [Chloroflexales bacterium]